MKIGSLCTGYGGLDLAVEAVTGAKTIWYSEFDKHVSKIMEHHRPNLPNLGDLTKVDWSNVEPIDIITAGYPCQPFSTAGQRKGTNDPRHIWPHIAEAISLLRPKLVILENVRGHLTLGFDEVLRTLTEIGYDARWEIVRASDVGAPHQRARLFVIAYPQSTASLTSDTNSDACEKSRRTDRGVSSQGSEIINETDREIDWGCYKDAIERWEQLTRKCPNPIDDQNRLNPVFVEWMMGLEPGWVTQIGLSRTQELKALGNGVVPQQAAYALTRLLNY